MLFCSLNPGTEGGFAAEHLLFERLPEIRAIASFMERVSMESEETRRTALALLAWASGADGGADPVETMDDLPVERLIGPGLEELVHELEATPAFIAQLGYSIARLEQIATLYEPDIDLPILERFLLDLAPRTLAYPRTNEGTASRIAELFLALATDLDVYLPKFRPVVRTIAKLQLYLSVYNHGSLLPISYHAFPDELFVSPAALVADWIVGNARPAFV